MEAPTLIKWQKDHTLCVLCVFAVNVITLCPEFVNHTNYSIPHDWYIEVEQKS